MVKRMLIDAAHAEETRVAVLDGNRLEEFDYETSTKKQLKGNIYLAKVTRVEPSLQACFVEYGGNRHGFLAFSEIHPDYYQIPVADREALMAEQVAAHEAALEEEEEEEDDDDENEENASGESQAAAMDETPDDPIDDTRPKLKFDHRKYKIQEVIKRRQILLIQVVKEERGNKGAALTTYLSLAGRYCVLMPNTPHGGGVSRKIGSGGDRKKLKSTLAELSVPDGMSVIIRTAGSNRTKVEIKRDYEYLSRLWDRIREDTLSSTAPALIQEEANLVMRAIRDLYASDIDEVVVDGAEGYKNAKNLMKMLTPSHAARVKLYKDDGIPLFHRYQIETQIETMHSPRVELRSGGSLVINPTEALVSIDINSGRATRERHIEETALKTNLEAAEEIARQMRLRDLAGLVVIDFIDMMDRRNQEKVERKLKECVRRDRARIQVGRISTFGLMELSRQRLRPSVYEVSSHACPTCAGSGHIRSTESTALHILRMIEEEGLRQRSAELTVAVPTEVALYILNNKRRSLGEMEAKYDLQIRIKNDDRLVPPNYRMDRVRAASDDSVEETPVGSSDTPVQSSSSSESAPAPHGSDDQRPHRDRGKRRRGGRRRGKRGGGDGDGGYNRNQSASNSSTANAENSAPEPKSDSAPATVESSAPEPKSDSAPVPKADSSVEKPTKPSRRRSSKPAEAKNESSDSSAPSDPKDNGPKKTGWWAKKSAEA